MAQYETGASTAVAGEPKLVHSSETTILDLLKVVGDNLRLLILVPLIVGVIAFALSYLITPVFTAKSVFLPPQQQSTAATMLQSLGALGGLAAGATGLKNPTDQYVAFMKSTAIQDALVDRFKLQEKYTEKFREDARAVLQGRTRVLSGKENLITVEFDDTDPKFAAEVANAYVEELGILLNRLAVSEAQQRRTFFDKQLAETKVNLIKAEQTLAATGVSVSTLNANPSTALEGPARLRAQITAQEVRLASMRSYLTANAPEYRQAAAELSALRGQLSRAEQQQPSSGSGSDDYIAKYREFKYQETLFELFAKQFEIAKVDESREGALVQVLDAAQPPDRKSKPKRALIGAVSAIFVGFVLVLFVFVRFAIRREARDEQGNARLRAVSQSFGRAIGKTY